MSDSRNPRPRRKSSQPPVLATHPIGSPIRGVSPNTGPLATAAWLLARGLSASEARWYAEVYLSTDKAAPEGVAPTTFRAELFREEWGFWLRHEEKVSWIRVTDVPFVHGRDEHGLLARTPPLKKLGTLVRELQSRYDIRFDFETAVVRTSLLGAEPAIREWIGSW